MAADVGYILSQWESVGVFDYVLPFLLIFAVIFGILSATNVMGKNKGIHTIIALVIALMAIRLDMVTLFFREVFPRTAVALSIILVAVILTAMFIPKEHMGGWAIGFYSLGGVAFIFVMFNTFSEFDWFGSSWWDEWGGMLIGALLLIAVIVVVAVTSGEKSGESKPLKATFGPWR